MCSTAQKDTFYSPAGKPSPPVGQILAPPLPSFKNHLRFLTVFSKSVISYSNWIEEILRGLASQYSQLKQESKGNMTGFMNVTGKQLTDLFTKNAGSWKRILYHLKMASHAEKVWVVEQLAYGRGYRVYISNDDAFSLKAWLTTGDLSALHGTDVFMWKFTLSGSSKNLTNVPAHLKPWMEFLRDYNISQVDQNLQKARNVFGRGVILTKTAFFDQYLAKLAKLADSLSAIVGTSNLWTKELQDLWIAIFGSPDPRVYPGVAYNFYKGGDAQKNPLAVRVLEIDELSEANCPAHMNLLKSFLRSGMTSPKPPSTTRLTTTTRNPTTIKDGAATVVRPGFVIMLFAVVLAMMYCF